MTRPILLLSASALALAACTDPDQVPSDDPRANTKTGIIAGATLGAIAGLASSGDPEAVLLGAAVGGGIGAAIGDQLDRQAAELRETLDDRVRIVNTGNELIVTMPEDILFAVDSTTLRPDLQADLAALATNLQRYPDSVVEIVGHTDNTGEASYNQDLSGRRADAVAQVLFAGGVTPSRVQTFGQGEAQPVASNLTPEGRRQNRRVEIFIRPVT